MLNTKINIIKEMFQSFRKVGLFYNMSLFKSIKIKIYFDRRYALHELVIGFQKL